MGNSVDRLLDYLDDFISEAKAHSGYANVKHIYENPAVQLISQIAKVLKWQYGYDEYNFGLRNFAIARFDGRGFVFDYDEASRFRNCIKAHRDDLQVEHVVKDVIQNIGHLSGIY